MVCYVSSAFDLYLLELLKVISNYQLVAFENHLFPWEYDRTAPWCNQEFQEFVILNLNLS